MHVLGPEGLFHDMPGRFQGGLRLRVSAGAGVKGAQVVVGLGGGRALFTGRFFPYGDGLLQQGFGFIRSVLGPIEGGQVFQGLCYCGVFRSEGLFRISRARR
jgi:hypothetical protein